MILIILGSILKTMYIINIPKTDFFKYSSLKCNISKEYKQLLLQTKTNQEIQTSILGKLVNSKQVIKLFIYINLKMSNILLPSLNKNGQNYLKIQI